MRKELKMKRTLRRKLAVCVLALAVVGLGIAIGGDVIVKEGTIEADCTVQGSKFKTTGATASGINTVALGYSATASGHYSTAIGHSTTASGYSSTAIGLGSEASGTASTAIGLSATASAGNSIAMGHYLTNDVAVSFAVGYGGVDLRVEGDVVTMYDDVYVHGQLSAEDVIDRSNFYDKDNYGPALGHVVDSSETIKVNGEGVREYNHEADPVFLQRAITVKDYDKYTEEEVWNAELEMYETRRIYETHEELGSSLSAKAAWLAQCIFELKQENEMLKAELAKLKAAVGVE
jgi:hypothetical protein